MSTAQPRVAAASSDVGKAANPMKPRVCWRADFDKEHMPTLTQVNEVMDGLVMLDAHLQVWILRFIKGLESGLLQRETLKSPCAI